MTQRVRFLIFISLIGILVLALPVAAQTDCPASILLAIARAGAACNAMERNQACVGSGTVSSVVDGGGAFARAGDIVNLDALRSFTTSTEGGFPVVLLRVQANLRDNEQRVATMIAFGNISLVNNVPALPTMVITSTGTLNIRAQPNIESEIITKIGIRETVIANGRAGTWLRVLIPDTPANRTQHVPQIGWVSLDGPLSFPGTAGTLTAVTPAEPFVRPFADFSLSGETDDALCVGAPESGLLVQSPSVDVAVNYRLAEINHRLAGTIFIQADGAMNVVDGGAELVDTAGTLWYVAAGARWQAGTLTPIDALNLAGVPVNLLLQRIRVAAPLAQAEIDAQNATHFVPTPTPVPTLSPEQRNVCQYRIKRDDSLRAGPGSFYEITNSVTRDQRVEPVYQTTDPDGGVWYQLRNGNWIPITLLNQTGECQPVPILEVVRPPSYNSIALEDCVTSNGPIRAGQRVTLTFVPAPWDTIGEALMATRVDPGTIKINDVGLRVYASDPILLGPTERYVRTFSATWTAEAGVQRIVGQRLSYVVSCDLTVPVG